jgi:ATP-dependent DNA ligase
MRVQKMPDEKPEVDAFASTLPEPMEARLVEALPEHEGWSFEPKWDGFRAIAARDGERIALMSKSGKSLLRYFPELGAMLASLEETSFILDGEIILPLGDHLSFDALQQRLHPAASRIARLALETPAELMLFDCLKIGAHELIPQPLTERRSVLERFYGSQQRAGLRLSPATTNADVANGWLDRSGGALDGIVAKALAEPYRPGERAMLKVKQVRSADCIVGGFRRTKEGDAVASLLLGLYGDDGRLHHVGFCSGFSREDRRSLLAQLTAHAGGPGFTGKAPGGPSRWSAEATPWEPLLPGIIVEVAYDQVTGDRFRHGTRFLRWRPDKAPAQCDFSQLAYELRPAELAALLP